MTPVTEARTGLAEEEKKGGGLFNRGAGAGVMHRN